VALESSFAIISSHHSTEITIGCISNLPCVLIRFLVKVTYLNKLIQFEVMMCFNIFFGLKPFKTNKITLVVSN
jgi:hypothetical protein